MSVASSRSGIVVGMLLLAALVAPAPLLAAKVKTEEHLIQDLGSPVPGTVTDALHQLEKQYPGTTKALPAIKGLLMDSRPKVRRKAARVLGALHSDVEPADITAICALLKSAEPDEVIDGLKSLRGLKAPGAVAEIVPQLQHANTHVVRDACRTLAALGDKDTIKAIDPLLNNPDPAVKKDAQDAIFQLNSK